MKDCGILNYLEIKHNSRSRIHCLCTTEPGDIFHFHLLLVGWSCYNAYVVMWVDTKPTHIIVSQSETYHRFKRTNRSSNKTATVTLGSDKKKDLVASLELLKGSEHRFIIDTTNLNDISSRVSSKLINIYPKCSWTCCLSFTSY